MTESQIKFDNKFGMTDELDRIYGQTLGMFAYSNANTNEQQNDCLNTIRFILDSSTMTYIQKLYTINMYVRTNKDVSEYNDYIISLSRTN